MGRILAHHGTVAAPFETFKVPPSGAHFGSFDQAAHAATLKLGRMPAKEFERLTPDSSGWRGRILMVELDIRNPLPVKDARTGAAWSRLIKSASAAGHDGLVYQNAYEGREPELSYVAFKAEQIRILAQDVRIEEPEPAQDRPVA